MKAEEQYLNYISAALQERIEIAETEAVRKKYPSSGKNIEKIRKYKESPEFINDRDAYLSRDSIYQRLLNDPQSAMESQDIQEDFLLCKEEVDRLASLNDAINLGKLRRRLLKAAVRDHISGNDPRSWFGRNAEMIAGELCPQIEKHFSGGDLYANETSNIKKRRKRQKLTADNWDSFIDQYINGLDPAYVMSLNYMQSKSMNDYLYEKYVERDEYLQRMLVNPDINTFLERELRVRVDRSGGEAEVMRHINRRFTLEEIEKLVFKNRRYAKQMREVRMRMERERFLRQNMLRSIPDNYIDLYPLAREIKRRFILHIGPTNSGKTYGAIEAMKAASSGIYLGPLRLLAYEQFEKLNSSGFPCRLVTGEERIDTEGAVYQASTVEMMDPAVEYEVAVIDEAQMIEDSFRGGSWTSAILGVRAKEVHVCAAAHAQNLIMRLVRDCGDDIEVVHHERQTPLIMEETEFVFPDSVEDKDALIVFSKKDVHACASDLQSKGIKCSVIYGALPYNVRHEEARKFLDGETNVVVATDAIGMGLNLPARRVVFLETEKYDGFERRPLKAGEIQQIAGRAGRYGIYDSGFCNSFGHRRYVAKKLEEKLPDIEEAVMSFPETLIGLDAPLSEILKRWDDIPVQEGYRKAGLEREIALCELLERETDDKYLIYRFITIPFDEKSDSLQLLWLQFFRAELSGQDIDLAAVCPRVPSGDLTADDLPELEESYRIYDLTYYYLDRFGHEKDIGFVLESKMSISRSIMGILESQKLKPKTCRSCGRKLMWYYPYGVCQRCFERQMFKHHIK
jgi:ATP-dependent RNA helicase SUPV3L1/SUV3